MSQTVDRALRILIDLGSGPKSLDQIAGLLGVHKSTALRLLQTLEQQGFTRHDEQHRHRLGPRLFALGQQALDDLSLPRVAAPHLGALSSRHGHTIHLAEYIDGAVVYVDKYESKHQVRMASRIGATAPAHCTAVGKILIAWLPEPRRRAAVDRIDYRVHTLNTIPDPERFLAELDKVAEQGFAVDRAEHEAYINCVAAPIRDAAGTVLAAVSITAPEPILGYEGVLDLLPDLLAAADAVSSEFGWPAASQPSLPLSTSTSPSSSDLRTPHNPQEQ